MINKDEFRAALGRFASGVTVITSKDAGGGLHGITVSAFCSVSLDPPLVLICIDKNTGTHHALQETDAFVVNVLSDDQQHLSDRFASYLPHKFDQVAHTLGINDLPVITDALANLECVIVQRFDGGDHTIYVGQIERATVGDGEPLIYFHGNYRKLKTEQS